MAASLDIVTVTPTGFEAPVVAQPDWTVLRLKQQLARDHPWHPAPADQRLVHGGRILLDDVILRSFLRVEDGGAATPHKIHLVVPQELEERARPSMSHAAVPAQTPDEGLRHRFVAHAAPAASPAATMASTPVAAALDPHTAALHAYYYWYYQSMGYSPEQLHAFSQAAQLRAAAVAAPEVSAAFATTLAAAAAADAAPDAAAGAAAPAAADAAAAAAPQAAPLGNDEPGRFAQAGLGAVPLVPEENEEQEGVGFTSLLALILRLAAFVWLMGQNTDETRFMMLIAAAIAIFIFQSGILRLFWRPQPRREAPVPAARNNNDAGDGEAPAAAAAPAEPEIEEPQTVLGEIREIVTGFLFSFVPAQQEIAA